MTHNCYWRFIRYS